MYYLFGSEWFLSLFCPQDYVILYSEIVWGMDYYFITGSRKLVFWYGIVEVVFSSPDPLVSLSVWFCFPVSKLVSSFLAS